VFIPPGLITIARDDTWLAPVPLDRMVEHIIEWLDDPNNATQVAQLLPRLHRRLAGHGQ
jgi:hypothetical protein